MVGIELGALAIPALAITSVRAVAAPGQAAAGAGPSVPGTGTAQCPWMNTRLSADTRADLLLKASTLGQELRWLDEQAANTPTQTTFGGVTYPAQVPCTPTVVYTDGPSTTWRTSRSSTAR